MQSKTFSKLKSQIISAKTKNEVANIIKIAEDKGANYVQIKDLKSLSKVWVNWLPHFRDFSCELGGLCRLNTAIF